jgi:predicted nuclease of predicted toxin-antitoxin system
MTTRFLVDANVNQKALRTIPAEKKGFDFLYPEAGSFKQDHDTAVRKRATLEQRVLVTNDKDFSRFNLTPQQIPHGVVWLRPARGDQRGVATLIKKFCAFLQEKFPDSPYEFDGRMVEVHEDGVVITDRRGSTTNYPLETR